MRLKLIAAALSLLIVMPVLAQEACVRASDSTIISKFNRWNLSLATMDPHAMTELYWPDAVLVSDPHRSEIAGTQALTLYFSELMSAHPRAHVDSRHIYNGCGFSIDVGHYTVSTLNSEGVTEDHSGIFSLVYLARNGQWKILHQNLTPIEDEAREEISERGHGLAESLKGGPESPHESGHEAIHGAGHSEYTEPSGHDHETPHSSEHEEKPDTKHESTHESTQESAHESVHDSSHEKPHSTEAKHEPVSPHGGEKHGQKDSAEDKPHKAATEKPKGKPATEEGENGLRKTKDEESHSESQNADVIPKVVPAYLLRTGENLQPTAFLKVPPSTSPDTVGLKVCLSNGQTTAVVVDPSTLPGLNEAAIAWAQASHWNVAGGHDSVVCSHVVARFPAAKRAAEPKEGSKENNKDSTKEGGKEGSKESGK